MKRAVILWLAVLLTPAVLLAQDPPDGDRHEEHVQGALGALKEIQRIMGESEESLHGASLGKGVLTQKEILKRLRDLEQDPEKLQKEVLKLVDRLLKRSEKDQDEVIKRLARLIKKSKQ